MHGSSTLSANNSIEGKKKAILFFSKTQLAGNAVYIVGVMLVSILLVFLNPNLQILTGPILTACFTYLYFNGNKELVTAIIIVANDSLGCILLGNISFPYLLLILYFIFILQRSHFSIRRSQVVAGVILIISLLALYKHGVANIKNIIYTLTYICAAGQCVSDQVERNLFFKGIAITVFLISIHTCITGGVEFYTLNEFSTEFLRKGILGTGIGDSNMSSLLLNIGIACTIFDDDFRWYMKVIMVACALYAMSVTLSTTGLIGLILTFCCFIIVRRESIPRKIWRLIFAVLALFIAINLYMSLPMPFHNVTIDAYIDRITEKLDFLSVGNLNQFTTNRSNIANIKLDYYWNGQGILGILFGFNSLFAGDGTSVPHNTYIDLLLQIGLIGTSIAVSYMLFSTYMEWKRKTDNKLFLVLKAIFLYYFMSLSLYQGSLFALAYICMIVI